MKFGEYVNNLLESKSETLMEDNYSIQPNDKWLTIDDVFDRVNQKLKNSELKLKDDKIILTGKDPKNKATFEIDKSKNKMTYTLTIGSEKIQRTLDFSKDTGYEIIDLRDDLVIMFSKAQVILQEISHKYGMWK